MVLFAANTYPLTVWIFSSPSEGRGAADIAQIVPADCVPVLYGQNGAVVVVMPPILLSERYGAAERPLLHRIRCLLFSDFATAFCKGLSKNP